MRLQRALWKSLSRLYGVYCMHLLLLTTADMSFLYSHPEAGMRSRITRVLIKNTERNAVLWPLEPGLPGVEAAFPFAGLCLEDRDTAHGTKKYWGCQYSDWRIQYTLYLNCSFSFFAMKIAPLTWTINVTLTKMRENYSWWIFNMDSKNVYISYFLIPEVKEVQISQSFYSQSSSSEWMSLQHLELSDSTGSKEKVSFSESPAGEVEGPFWWPLRSLPLSHCPSDIFGLGVPAL